MQRPTVHPASLEIKDYNYHLPDEKIARYPLEERDASRLLIYQGNIKEDIYRNIADYIPQQSLLVFNQTRVVNARLLFQKPTGGKIEVFCLEPDARYADVQTAMSQQQQVYWKCLVGGAAKWKSGQVLELNVPSLDITLYASLETKAAGYFILKISWNTSLTFAEVLQHAGAIPLPPYLNRDAAQSDEERYQTMFAREEGSVAAPTAALHFTDNILQSLTLKDISTSLLTLHVGAGTFRPVKSDTMEGHDMHAEWIEITPDLLKKLIQQKEAALPIVATGTTTARTLESLYWIGIRLLQQDDFSFSEIAVPQWFPYEQDMNASSADALKAVQQYMLDKNISRLVTRTQIIIAPGYEFKIIDALITNFHQPQSTLLLLVSALVGEAWKEIYDYAYKNDFRFLSYGDGSLLWANK